MSEPLKIEKRSSSFFKEMLLGLKNAAPYSSDQNLAANAQVSYVLTLVLLFNVTSTFRIFNTFGAEFLIKNSYHALLHVCYPLKRLLVINRIEPYYATVQEILHNPDKLF